MPGRRRWSRRVLLAVAAVLAATGGAAAPDPVSLSAYVQAVLAASPEVSQAQQGLAQARAGVAEQWSELLLPTFGFSGLAYPYGEDPGNNYVFNHWMLNRDNLDFNASIDVNLFNSFFDYRRLLSARKARAAADEALKQAAQQRALAAVQAFLDLDAALRLQDVARENADAQQRQFGQTKTLVERGIRSLSDSIKGETDWRSSQLRLASAEADAQTAQLRFNILLGRDAFESVMLDTASLQPPDGLPTLGADLPRALSGRPEVLQAKAQADISAFDVQDAAQQLIPKLTVDALWNHQDVTSAGVPPQELGIPDPNYQLQLALSLPVDFRIGNQLARLSSARAAERKARAGLELAARDVREQVQAAYILLQRDAAAYQLSGEKESLTQRGLQLVSMQFAKGAADSSQLSIAQLDYLSARVERISTLKQYELDRAQYRFAVGDMPW